MNIKATKKHILEELAHGKPIQRILSPERPKVEAIGDEGVVWVDDPDWVRPDLPDWNLVVQWLKDDEAFARDYEHAMKYGAVYLSDELVILKDKVVADPKNATAYKVAMEAIRTAAMWRDPKYSERTIQEVKNTAPQDPEVVAARIQQLKEELGIVDVKAKIVPTVEVPKASDKKREAVRENLRKAREARARKRLALKGPDASSS